jgi:ribosome biogenesis GTPase / thiamine phosphate phosphatase
VKAIVYKSTGSWYSIKDEAGKFWNARTKGVMKLDDITSTNPIAVGDAVQFEIEDELSSTAMIDEILPRDN